MEDGQNETTKEKLKCSGEGEGGELPQRQSAYCKSHTDWP